MIYGYSLPQIRKALVALVGAVVAVLAHFDVAVGDAAGDAIFVIDSILTPIAVLAVRNESR